MSIIWVNGEFKEREEARVSPFDNAFLSGDALSETIITYDSKAFLLGRHISRLINAAKLMMMPFEILEKTPWLPIINQLIEANKYKESIIRITYTAGEMRLGVDREISQPQLFITLGPVSYQAQEASLTVVPWIRNERSPLCGVKTISYAENVKALQFAKMHGMSEALFLNSKGNVCEGSNSNIFWIKGNTLCTPALSTGCLPGITRSLILSLAPTLGLQTSEVEVPLKAVQKADEVFITSTLREIQFVTIVADVIWENFKCKQTAKIREAFKDYIKKNS